MPKTRPTEEDLGIEITPEEQAALDRPAPEIVEDDIAQIEDADDIHQVAAPKPVAEQPEKIDARKTREHAPDGKFVPKKDEPATDAHRPPPGFVDTRALQEARAENKLLMERTAVLLETLTRREAAKAKAEEPAPPAIPDKAVDPLGYIDHLEGRLGAIENETKSQREAREANDRDQAEMNQVLAVAVPQYTEATAADPTLEPTRMALMESYAVEIAFHNGIPLDGRATPQQKQFLAQELSKLENGHIKFAVASQKPIGDYIRDLAAARRISAGAPQPNGKGGPQQIAPPNGQRPIADRVAAQQRHQSLGDMSGGPAPTGISAKDIAKMSAKQFAEFAKSVGDDKLDEMFSKA